MADKVKVELLRPLNGAEIGSEATYDKADADRLAASGAVKIVGKADPEPQAKAEGAAPENKAEGAAPDNKAAAAASRKRRTGKA